MALRNAAALARLLHASYTPLTRLLHAPYLLVALRNAAALARLLHASYTPLTRLLHAPYLLVALRNAAALGKGDAKRELSLRVPGLRRLRIPIKALLAPISGHMRHML